MIKKERKIGNRGILFIVIVCLIILGSLYLLINCSKFTSYIHDTYDMSITEFISIVLEFISIFITIALGIIVYKQSERINMLEISQYEMFLGVGGIQYNDADQDVFELMQRRAKLQGDFDIYQEDGSAYLTFSSSELKLGNEQGRYYLIPFKFITKNQVLITSINFKKISISWLKNGNPIKKKFQGKEDIIYRILEDNSSFVFELQLLGEKISEEGLVKVSFDICLENQYGEKCNFKIYTTLRNSGNIFILLDSKTAIYTN